MVGRRCCKRCCSQGCTDFVGLESQTAESNLQVAVSAWAGLVPEVPRELLPNLVHVEAQ